MPTPPIPPANNPTTTFQVGTWNALTDTWSLVLDLNDFRTFWIQKDSMRLPQPKKVFVRSSNIRFPGENVLRYQYQNRHIQVSLRLKNVNTPTILSSIRALLAAIENPPYTLRIALPGATQYSYADVVAVQHNIPSDPQALLAQIIPSIQIDFECKAGLRGDRVWLQNLVMNPGFEAPSGPPVVVFTDTFANGFAYTVQAGSSPSVASNQLTLPASSIITFGSTAWGAINQWRFRFQYATSLSFNAIAHFVDANNNLFVNLNGSAMTLNHTIGGTNHSLGSVTANLTATTFYWLTVTLFPQSPGGIVPFQATVSNDSSGAIGTTIATVGPVGTFDTITALIGHPGFQTAAGASLVIGGNFLNVHTVSLFGPGGWTFSNTGTGTCSGAQDGMAAGAPTATNSATYPGGPVTSYGAARIDIPPGGTVTAFWNSQSGAVLGILAPPVLTPGDTLQASIWAHSVGLHATNATVYLMVNEYNNVGTFLRQDIITSVPGGTTNGGWTHLTGSVVTGANCFSATVVGQVSDTAVAGESGFGAVWFDNAQLWDQTTNGSTTMPYCELRYPQSPAQLMVSGVAGDMIAPCVAEIGGWFSNFTTGQSGVVYLGRRATTTAGIRMAQASTVSNLATLDTASWGGFNCTANLGPIIISNQAEGGTFHILGRAETANGSSGGVTIAPQVFTVQVPVGQLPRFTDAMMAAWQGANVNPFTATSVWTSLDAGQIILPLAPNGIIVDPTQQASYISTTSGGAGGSQLTVGYMALLPVDGDLFIASLYNPTVGTAKVNSWVFLYWDGNTPGATTYSVESAAIAYMQHSASDQGPTSNAFTTLLVTPTADSLAQLDPTLSTSTATGVNQFLVHFTDNVATVTPVAVDFVYSPLYLYPR